MLGNLFHSLHCYKWSKPEIVYSSAAVHLGSASPVFLRPQIFRGDCCRLQESVTILSHIYVSINDT